ncbi:MAG TPA: TetR/AcrR family transcriptional regulator C-terminal domain-containing protein [Marmoricola sp.]|nr:TetR/AcrR family transcriptional regulator C-terminal domain-containing protein [Marmoricola sp.]
MAVPASPRRGRPQRISRDAIVAAALELGPADLRMADVARALDVGPAALYNHVRDRDELLALMAARILDETEYDDFEPGEDATWQEWISAFAHATRSAILTNPQLLQYVRLTSAPTGLRLDRIEHLASVMDQAGFATAEVQQSVQLIYTLALGEAWQQALAADGEDPQFAEFGRGVSERAGDLPHLADMVAARPEAEAQFAFALDLLLSGLERRLPR